MIQVAMEKAGTALILKLSGEVDESFDLTKSLPGFPPEFKVNCKGITRINSVGVKAWIGYFSKVPAGQVKLSFIECSPIIVEQLNMIKNFKCNGTIESICVPFLCSQCSKTVTQVFTTQELPAIMGALPSVKCACGGQAEFDDLPEEYFAFLK